MLCRSLDLDEVSPSGRRGGRRALARPVRFGTPARRFAPGFDLVLRRRYRGFKLAHGVGVRMLGPAQARGGALYGLLRALDFYI